MERLGIDMEKRWILDCVLIGAITLFSTARASIFDGELSSPSSVHSLLRGSKNLSLELGLEYSRSDLPTLHNIVVENTSTSTAVTGPVMGDVKAAYPDAFAQTLKLQAILSRESRFTVAAKTYLPLNGLSQMDTGNVYQPEVVLYRAESQRPRILFTAGRDINSDWRVGLGVDVGFSVSAQANVFLQSGPGTVSDQRISAKVKPNVVPQASLAFRQYQLTARSENRADLELTTNAGARIFSDVGAGIDFSYQAQSALYYQPWQLEFNAQNELLPWLILKYGISYELWSGYKSRAAVIKSNIPINCPKGSSNCSPQFSSGLAPAFKARNIWVPEVGVKFAIGENSVEVDYQFKDSIFKDLPTGQGNYLDPPRHDLRLGFTYPTASGLEWKIHATLSRLTAQNVVKSDPNAIGGPGYQMDGWLYGGGLSVAIPFEN